MNRRRAGFSRLLLEEGCQSMSSHVFHEIYLRINWHAKNNHPLLTAKQKEHHAQGTTKRRLEQMGYDDDGMPLASA